MSTQGVPESTQVQPNQGFPHPMAPDPLPMEIVVKGEDGPIVLAPNKPGRPPRDPDDWTEPFLRYYAEWGNQYNAARFAGVDAKTARKHRRSTPEFDRAVRDARRAFKASMQEELVKQAKGLSRGNTIATLARLKATGRKMAERYSEKAVDARILNITQNVYNAPAALGASPPDTLRAWLKDTTPATRALLAVPERSEAIEDAEIAGETPGETGETP